MAKITISDLPNAESTNFISELASGDFPLIFGGGDDLYSFYNLGVQALSYVALATTINSVAILSKAFNGHG